MPKFVIEREIPGASKLTEAELREVLLKSLGIAKYISTLKRCANQAAAAIFFSHSASTLSKDLRDQRNACA